MASAWLKWYRVNLYQGVREWSLNWLPSLYTSSIKPWDIYILSRISLPPQRHDVFILIFYTWSINRLLMMIKIFCCWLNARFGAIIQKKINLLSWRIIFKWFIWKQKVKTFLFHLLSCCHVFKMNVTGFPRLPAVVLSKEWNFICCTCITGSFKWL